MNSLDLTDAAYITEEIESEMKRSILNPGDVLLNITGASIGRVAHFGLRGIRANVNQHVCIIRPKPAELDSTYLAYFISSPPFQKEILRLQRGGTRQALTFAQIANFQVPLPAISTQKRIAAILDKADGIRRRREETLKLLESYENSLFNWA
jgi:type I restriction enzyme S subunit